MDPAPASTRRRPILGFAACALALVASLPPRPARGQTPVSGQAPRVFVPLASIPGITGVTPWTFDDPDDGQVAVSIPFDFHFLGGTYTAINVGTNGLFTFGAEDASAYSNTAPGSASAPDLWIAPFWDDLRHPQADNVRSGLLGTAPNRILVVEAGPVPRYGSTTPLILYQAWLYEGATGRFDIQVDGSLAGASGTVGFEGPGGTPFESPFDCSPDCDAATLAAMQGVAFTTLLPVDPELTGLFGALPRGALPGQSVLVPVTVQNVGQRAAATVTSALYLSLDDQRDATDTLVGTVVHGPVAAQGQLTRGATLTVPAAVAIGDLRLILFVDSNDAHPEVVESDNVVVAPTPFATGRDLVPTAITALGNGNPGDTVSFDLTVASPALPLTGNVEIAVYASTDTVRDAADPLVLRQAVSLSGQPSEDFTLAGVLPSLAPGSYYPIAVVDSAAALTEIDEQNNVLAGAAPFLSGPDLSVLSVSAPSAAAPATDFLVDTELGSIAVPYSGVVTYRLLLSRDDRADAQDTLLGSFTVTFAGEGSLTDQTTVTMPAVAPGAYALLAVVDPAAAIAESNEANNLGVAPASISNAPDLRVESVVAGASSEPGVTLSLTADLRTDGLPIIGPVSYRVSLSGDALRDPGDAEVARGVVNVVGAGTTSFDASFTLPLGAPVGRRWAIVEIDPEGTIGETDETNNWSASAASIDVRGPDLTPLRISGPPVGYLGLAYPAQVTVQNAGRATARQFRYAVVLSDDAVIRSDDLTLFLSETATLAPNQSQTYAPELLLPAAAAPGTKWLGVIVDPGSAIGEEDETNNARAAGAPFRLVPPIPDLTGAIIDTPTIAAAGEPLAITRTLRNEGVADSGAFSFVVVLSRDPQIDAGDVVIGGGMTALPAGGEEQAIERAAIPPDVPAGSYFVGLILDPEAQIEEPRRDNNLILGPSLAVYASSIRFLVDRLPVATVGVPYEAGLFATGGPLPLVWSVSPAVLPPGLTLDPASGILAGVATTEGTYELRVRVSAGSAFVERLFSLRVADPTVELAVGTPSLPPGVVGRSYTVTLVALGGLSPYRWSAIGTLPPGLALSVAGELSGTPSAPGNFRLEVEVGDDTGSTARRSLALNVASAGQSLVIQQQALPPAIVGLEYCDPDPTSFTARGGLMPYRWSIEGDAVAGLSLSPDGRLCGVPTQVGEQAVLIRVEDQAGLFDTALFILEVRSGDTLTILTSVLPPASVGESYAAAIEVHGGTVPFQFSLVDGAPPEGVSLAASGELTGVPTLEGLSPFLVRVTDAQGRQDVRPLAIAVRSTPAGSAGGCGCRASGRSGAGAGAGAEAWLAGLLALGLASRRARRRALAVTVLIAASAAPGSIHAQAPVPGTPYTLHTTSQPYQPLSTPIVLLSAPSDDDEVTVPLPFPFRFYDGAVSSARVGTNGALLFDSEEAIGSSNPAPGQSARPNAFIAPFWDDLIISSGEPGVIAYQVDGIAPARRITFEWREVDRYSGTEPKMSFSVRLFEGPAGRMEIDYGAVNTQATVTLSGTMAMEDAAGGRAIYLHPTACTSDCDLTALGAQRDTRVALALDFGIDLAAVDLDVSPTLYQGAPAAASVVIANLHRASLGPFRFVIRLGPESGAPGGTTVHTSGPLTLGPYEQRVLPVPFDLPPAATVGRYALALEVDSQSSIVEVDEANNRVTRGVAIRPGIADLTPVSLTVTATATAAGQRLYVDARLANVGVRTASGAEALVLLSGNPVITDRDLTLARFSVDLAAGASRTTSVAVDLPADLRSGRYYVGLLADPSDAIPELSESNNGGAATSLVVNGAGLSVVSALLPRGVVGSLYLALLEAAGAGGPVTWSIASGALPLGLTLTAESGLISGVPLGAAVARIVVRAQAGTASASTALDLEILDPAIPLTVATRTLPAAYLGLEYEVRLTSAGGATSTRTWGATGLPDRFTLDASGLLHGLPIAAGSATIAVSVGDGVTTASRELRLEILTQGRILLEPTPLPPGTLGEPYQGAIGAAGGTPPLVFALESGVLPRGLSLSDDGQISGLPEEVGRFTVVVSVRDAETTSPADLGSYDLLIQDRPLLVVTTETLPAAHRGEAYEAVIESAHGTAPVRWRISEGSLPTGIAAEEVAASGTLRLIGTPEATEVAAFEVEVIDAVGRRATRVLALEVAPPRQLNVSGGCSCGVQRGHARLSTALLWLAILFGLGVRRRSRQPADSSSLCTRALSRRF